MKYILVLMFLIVAFLCMPSAKLLAHVERTYFLKGTIGQQDMAVKMHCYDEMPTRYIHYFFRNDKRDREMSGKD